MNRGIVKRGPYSLIRHPAYISKNLIWILSFVFHGASVLGSVIVLCTLYYFRAVTEERHLSKDLEYREYMKEVKYRFIPGVI